jgi:hypothetical protein
MKPSMLRVGAALLLCLAATSATSQEETSPLARLEALKAERLSTVPQATVSTTPAKSVVVNCAKGDSISAALAKNTGPLVIEVRGICQENVWIERSDVTLHGLDPASDGIRGVAPPAAIEINYARRVKLVNISVTDSPLRGIVARYSDVAIGNCWVIRNVGTGVLGVNAFVSGSELLASNNGGDGIRSDFAGYFVCEGCRLTDNGAFAARSREGGVMDIYDSVISGNSGVGAGLGGRVDVTCSGLETSYPCSLEASGNAASAWVGSLARLWVPRFTGVIGATDNSEVQIWGGEQTTSNGAVNWVGGRLTTGPWGAANTRLGTTNLFAFSRGVLYGTELLGTLTCDSGADAWSDTLYPASKVSGCAHVLTSTP